MNMSQIECPVCHAQIDFTNGGFCPQCGFEVKVSLQELPEEFKAHEVKKVEVHQKLWDDYSSAQEALKKAEGKLRELEEENHRLTEKIAANAVEIEGLKKKKSGVPFYLMQVDANRTFQLLPIDVGRTSFGSYVADQQAACQFHYCIDPSLDSTQFIIDCKLVGESGYELSLINNGTRRISINGSILNNSVRVMSPDVIEMDGFQLIILRP